MIHFSHVPLSSPLLGTLLAVALLSADAGATIGVEKQLEFRVFLEDQEIGYHRVALRNTQQATDVSVEASFDVKILFIKAFSYRHQARERWIGDCLESVETETKYGGDPLYVRSETTDNGLKIINQESVIMLPGCVRSYAYWDLERLRTSRLLNTQSGEYQPVTITELGIKPLRVGEFSLDALSYELTTEEGTITLWYGDEQQWLGLQTQVKGNRILSYINEAIHVDA